MELKIYNPTEADLIKKIEWNFEELKQEIVSKAEEYKNLVYEDEQIREAKTDRAKLNKFVAALEEKRIELKKQVMIPYVSFETEEKQLVAIINEANSNIDTQVKAYEEKQRAEKLEKVKKIYEECVGDLDRVLPFEKVFKQQYINASTSLKSTKEEISNLINKVNDDLKIINNDMGKFVFEMKEVYLRNFDMNEALKEKQRLEEAEQRKLEFEAKRKQQEEERLQRQKEQAQKVIDAGVRATQKAETPDPINSATKPLEKHPQIAEPTYTLDLRVIGTAEQLNSLKQYLKQNNIAFGPVPKEGDK